MLLFCVLSPPRTILFQIFVSLKKNKQTVFLNLKSCRRHFGSCKFCWKNRKAGFILLSILRPPQIILVPKHLNTFWGEKMFFWGAHIICLSACVKELRTNYTLYATSTTTTTTTTTTTLLAPLPCSSLLTASPSSNNNNIWAVSMYYV